jgi:hypothetical protein
LQGVSYKHLAFKKVSPQSMHASTMDILADIRIFMIIKMTFTWKSLENNIANPGPNLT